MRALCGKQRSGRGNLFTEETLALHETTCHRCQEIQGERLPHPKLEPARNCWWKVNGVLVWDGRYAHKKGEQQ